MSTVVLLTATAASIMLSACGSGGSGASACREIGTLDRSCTTATDCVALLHTTSCCGSASWIGLRSTERQQFSTLESACDASYPACGCASGPPTTDDLSSLAYGTNAAVTCTAGVCTTFSPACGRPCESGRSCSCSGAGMSFCSLHCTNDGDCTDPTYSKCQFGRNGGLCTDPNAACPGI